MALFDPGEFPEQFTETKAEPDLREQFIAFCRSKPADEAYDPRHINSCALGQFGIVGARHECLAAGVPGQVYDAAVYRTATWPSPSDYFTFGALLSRLEGRG